MNLGVESGMVSNTAAIFLSVEGETAFMSAKYSGVVRGSGREVRAERMRWAVARASRGGTTLRIREAEETRDISSGRRVAPEETARAWVSGLRAVSLVGLGREGVGWMPSAGDVGCYGVVVGG
jgi:hypothetical protein